MLTVEQKRHAMTPARIDYGDSDEWGTTMGHWFAIAETLHHAGATLPRRWQFRHGMSTLCNPFDQYAEHDPRGECAEDCEHEYPDVEYSPFLDAGELGIEMLTYAGNVLDRYSGWLKRAGKDY